MIHYSNDNGYGRAWRPKGLYSALRLSVMMGRRANDNEVKMARNVWEWWRNALRGQQGPVHEGSPEWGFYRTKEGEPVALWQADDAWVCKQGNRVIHDQTRIMSMWAWVCTRPITKEAYDEWFAQGHLPSEPPPSAGHNLSDDPHTAIRLELESEIEMADEFLAKDPESLTDDDADKVGVWSKRFSDIANRAETARKAEKEPFLEGGRKVDAKWKGPIVDKAAAYKDKLKRHLMPWLRKRDAEIRQMALEEAAAVAAEGGGEPEPPRKAPPKATAGRTGAKVTLQKVKAGKVTDYAAAALALVEMKHEDIITCIDKLANRAAKADKTFAGMEIVEEEVAR